MAKIQKLKTPELPSGCRMWDEKDGRPFVHIDVRTRVTWQGDTDPDDSWDRPDTDSSFEGVYAYANEPDNLGWYNEKFPVREPVSRNSVVHVVLVRYTTGDTFGTDSGNVAAVGVEVDEHMANELRVRVEKRIHDGFSFDNGGNEVELEGWSYYLGSWMGYFESVQDVWVESVVVK